MLVRILNVSDYPVRIIPLSNDDSIHFPRDLIIKAKKMSGMIQAPNKILNLEIRSVENNDD